jgi:hypothetical protein
MTTPTPARSANDMPEVIWVDPSDNPKYGHYGPTKYDGKIPYTRAPSEQQGERVTVDWLVAFLHANDDYLTESECKRVAKLLLDTEGAVTVTRIVKDKE